MFTNGGLSDSLIKCVLVQGEQPCVSDSVGRVAPTALVQQKVLLPHKGTTAQQTALAGQQALVHNEQPVALVPFSHYWLQANQALLCSIYLFHAWLRRCLDSSNDHICMRWSRLTKMVLAVLDACTC